MGPYKVPLNQMKVSWLEIDFSNNNQAENKNKNHDFLLFSAILEGGAP